MDIDLHTTPYLTAAKMLAATATDPYDALWWKFEVETDGVLAASEIHRRVMAELRKRKKNKPTSRNIAS